MPGRGSVLDAKPHSVISFSSLGSDLVIAGLNSFPSWLPEAAMTSEQRSRSSSHVGWKVISRSKTPRVALSFLKYIFLSFFWGFFFFFTGQFVFTYFCSSLFLISCLVRFCIPELKWSAWPHVPWYIYIYIYRIWQMLLSTAAYPVVLCLSVRLLYREMWLKGSRSYSEMTARWEEFLTFSRAHTVCIKVNMHTRQQAHTLFV